MRDHDDAVKLTHRGDGHRWGFSLVIREELWRTESANQVVGAWVRHRRKARLKVEVTVSDVRHPATRAAVEHQAGRGVEGDTVFLELLEDQPEGPDASPRPGGVKVG